MAEKIAFENGRNSNFEGLVTFTLDRDILHTIVHKSSTSTYMPNFIEIKETVCGRMDVHTDGRTVQVQSHVIQKLRQISKMRPDQI